MSLGRGEYANKQGHINSFESEVLRDYLVWKVGDQEAFNLK